MSDSGSEMEEETNYELIGVTVHTGTADGGHYYSFIRDRLSQNELGQDKWSVKSLQFTSGFLVNQGLESFEKP